MMKTMFSDILSHQWIIKYINLIVLMCVVCRPVDGAEIHGTVHIDVLSLSSIGSISEANIHEYRDNLYNGSQMISYMNDHVVSIYQEKIKLRGEGYDLFILLY